MTVQMDKYKVCIRCITYNHSEYITDALNGFASQQTDFPFIILLMDDASTDGEQEVIKAYIDEHFDLSDTETSYTKDTDDAEIIYARHKTNTNCYIAAFCLKTNHYQAGKDKIKYVEQWRNASDYEAICEGDDYWIDPLKLQKQVDYLDEHPECALVYTKAVKLKDDGTGVCIGEAIDATYGLLFKNVIPTLTVFIRLDEMSTYQEEVKPNTRGWRMGDYPQWLWLSMKGKCKIHFIDEVTAAYRVLAESASHSADVNRLIAFENSVYDIRRYFVENYQIGNRFLLKKIAEWRVWSIFRICIVNGMPSMAYRHLVKNLNRLSLRNICIAFAYFIPGLRQRILALWQTQF